MIDLGCLQRLIFRRERLFPDGFTVNREGAAGAHVYGTGRKWDSE